MNLTSVEFWLFFFISLLMYYLFPKRFQWGVLLVFSILFFCLSSTVYTGIYLLFTVAVTTVSARVIDKGLKNGNERLAKNGLIAGILLNLLIIFVLKYSNFFVDNLNDLIIFWKLSNGIPLLHLLAPIGISYYTFQIVGYLLDCYWGITTSQKSFLKTFLFTCYFPQMISGPISRHNDVKDGLFAKHYFGWNTVMFGMQRMMWGFFKKLVISARLQAFVDSVYAGYFSGLYIVLAGLVFVLQLYTDFSGCMDIVLGASECFGIKLPENFKTPFFSRSIQEFWQRWHITLGLWFKDYVMYPLLRSKLWNRLGKHLKKNYSKKMAKQLPAYLGMLVVWLLIGLWHGGEWKYVIGEGLWFCACIVLAQIVSPYVSKVYLKFHINEESALVILLQRIETFILVSIGFMFFRLDSIVDVYDTLMRVFHNFDLSILFNGDLFYVFSYKEDCMNELDGVVVFIALVILFLVEIMSQKDDVRELIAEKSVFVRWPLYFLLIFAVIIFGVYGPDYSSTSFIYQGF